MLSFIVLASLFTREVEAEPEKPQWVIVVTITDRVTGTLMTQSQLEVDLTFADLRHCQSFVDTVGPIPPTPNFAAVLTCREVERRDAPRAGNV
jgi:hypothetical protein